MSNTENNTFGNTIRNTAGNTAGNTVGNIAGNERGNNAGNNASNPYPPLLMSNNFNPFTVSPYTPLTANTGGDNRNPQVDSIRPYTVATIEVLGNLDIATPYQFSINGQQVLPNKITSGVVSAAVNENGNITNSEFVVEIGGTNVLTVMKEDATFEANGGGDFTLNVLGQTNTYSLTIGAPPITIPPTYVAHIVGNVLIDGSISSTGAFDISGLIIYNNLDISGLLTVSGEYIYNDLDVSGKINATNIYVQNNLDVSGQIDTSGMYVYNNLDVSGNAQITGNAKIDGNLDVSGSISFANISVTNANVSNTLTATVIDTSGININYPYITGDPSTDDVMQINGQSYFYNDVTIGDAGQLVVNTTNGPSQYSSIQPQLIVGAGTFVSPTTSLEVTGSSTFIGSVAVQAELDYRIQVLDVSYTISDISDQPTMYVVDCGGSARTIDLTGVTGSSQKVGVTYYFIATNTGPVNLLRIKYNSLDTGLNPVTSGGVTAPRLITLVCVNYDGTDNFFSAST